MCVFVKGVQLQETAVDDLEDSFVVAVGSSYLDRIQGRLQKTLAQNKKLGLYNDDSSNKQDPMKASEMTLDLSPSEADVFGESSEPSDTPYMSAVGSPTVAIVSQYQV